MMDDMKAVVVPRFGGPDVLTCDETAREECPSNKVSVKVIVAGLNPFDTYVREGTYFTLPTPPYIPGSDFAGVIDVVGDQVPPQPWLKTGVRVFGTAMVAKCGACAEYITVAPNEVSPLPEEASFEEGAAATATYLTAYKALFKKGNGKPGESLLIHGASGGVGTALAQIAKTFGLHVLQPLSTLGLGLTDFNSDSGTSSII
eukprot:Selendium_serpulae@DN6276_c0_g1_i1.p2